MEPISIVGGVVSNLVSKSLEAMGKAALKEVASWLGAQDELKKLKNTMRMIQARVRDAERRQEDDSSETIKEWLQRLKLVLYTADDLFDEILTRDRQKQQIESRMFGKVGILFSKSGPLYLNTKLAVEIKSIKEELDAIKSDMSVLNLRDLPAQQLPMARLIEKRETASLVNTDYVISRYNDQKNILKILFDPKYDIEKVTVIPIVGFGGLGKTTLAQLVFNDQRVKKHFDLAKWAYVPEIDNLNVIMRKIYNSFNEGDHDKLPLEQIKQGFRESIKNKKYFLVLDDIWDEGADRLIDLMSLLRCGDGNLGSKVIVTTRSDVAARVVGTIDRPYMLGTLTDAQSWDLFKLVAFKHGKENNPNFTKIGKEIVSMCGNVPLAIKVVGGFLRPKDTEKEWLLARDAQCSKAQLTKGSADIMSVLKLSYDYLPPALKQCFTYCSLFPKGSCFDRDDLVYMWMAQGYFEPTNYDRGDLLFNNMLARGFFQDPEFSDDGNVNNCKMHDLLNDLAQLVAGEECMVLKGESSLIEDTHGLLHVNLNCYELKAEVRSSLFVARRMRSFLSTVEVGKKDLKDLISRMQQLRLLKVKFEKSFIERLPYGIGRLLHLRYLYIESNIKYLPGSITRLENLQTLDVQRCRKLKELPSDFAKLINIRHLLLPKDKEWRDLPRDFGKLTYLQVLNEFVVGANNGIDSLPALKYKGDLVIRFKKWRTNCIVEAQKAKLKYCDQLTSLQLNLYGMVTFPIEEMNEKLMNLELPPNLRHLVVYGYKGDKMPSRWFDGLSKLVSISIKWCRNCKVVPHLSQLPHLKKVELVELEDLEMEEEEEETEEDGNSSRTSSEWQGLSSLRELRMQGICKMKKLPAGIITNLTTLEHLYIIKLENLIELPVEIGNLYLLRCLEIRRCPKLESFPTSLQGLTSFEHLDIDECPELKSLPTSLLSHTSLQYLQIQRCPDLEKRYRRSDGKDFYLIQHIPDLTIGFIGN